MTKFSIIIPVYNVEKYIDDCLDSILNQNYENYEVIIVNDGSKDNSQEIIDKYVKKDKRFKSYIKKNSGVSDTRNYGLKQAMGDYIIFIDSDDSINPKLLYNLSKEIEKNNNLDLIKYQINIIDDKKNSDIIESFSDINGEDAFPILINSSLFVTVWSYAYKKSFWTENKFEYASGKIHEDFCLIPNVVINAKHVSSIKYVGYNYYIREKSIMTDRTPKKIKIMTEDTLYSFDVLLKSINENKSVSEKTKMIFKSYISNTLISRAKLIGKENLKEYSKQLKSRKIYSYLIDDTLVRKIKKSIFKICPYLYLKYLVK